MFTYILYTITKYMYKGFSNKYYRHFLDLVEFSSLVLMKFLLEELEYV